MFLKTSMLADIFMHTTHTLCKSIGHMTIGLNKDDTVRNSVLLYEEGVIIMKQSCGIL